MTSEADKYTCISANGKNIIGHTPDLVVGRLVVIIYLNISQYIRLMKLVGTRLCGLRFEKGGSSNIT